MKLTDWTRRLLTPAAALLALGASGCTPYNDGYGNAGYYGGSGYSGGGYSGGGYYAPSYGYGYGGTTVVYGGGGRGYYDGRHRDGDYRGHVDRAPDRQHDGRWQRGDGQRGDGQRGGREGRDGRRHEGNGG